MGYVGFMLGGIVNSGKEAEMIINPLMDIMILLLSPMIGFLLSRRSFNCLKEDSYSQMLIYFRSLPIPIEVVMLSRYIQMGVAIIFNGIIVYGMMYVLAFSIGDIHVSEFLVFVLTWVGFTIMINALYIHFEYLTRGHTYLWFMILLMLCTGIAAIIVDALGGNVVRYTIQYSVKYGFASPLMWGTLIISIIMLTLLGRITKRKLEQRSIVK
ncbi:hypothetical protein D3C78_1239470 [compost metagenome]